MLAATGPSYIVIARMEWIMTLRKPAGAAERRSRSSSDVIVTRELPGKVIIRNLRSDVFKDALRAAETTLRAQKLPPRDSAGKK